METPVDSLSGSGTRASIRESCELEAWSPALRFLEAQVCADEDELRIGFARRLRNWKMVRYQMWAVRCLLGPLRRRASVRRS